MAAIVPARGLDPGEMVTQYGAVQGGRGEASAFHTCPRPVIDYDGLSASVGHWTSEEASQLVRGRASGTPEDDRVRYSTVGKLEKAGFTVTHKPNRRNPNHILVTHSRYGVAWPNEVEEAFSMCFDVTTEGGTHV